MGKYDGGLQREDLAMEFARYLMEHSTDPTQDLADYVVLTWDNVPGIMVDDLKSAGLGGGG